MIFAPLRPFGEEPTRADGQGRFKLSGLPARGNVWIVAVHPSRPLFAATEADPDSGFEVEMTLGALGAAVGSTVDGEGRPVSGCKVWVTPPDQGWKIRSRKLTQRLGPHGDSSETITDDEGRWSVDGLVPGADYDVVVWPPGGRGGTVHATFTAQPDETVDVGPVELEE